MKGVSDSRQGLVVAESAQGHDVIHSIRVGKLRGKGEHYAQQLLSVETTLSANITATSHQAFCYGNLYDMEVPV